MGQELELYWAARDGDEAAVARILQETPEVNVNWLSSTGLTALHSACSRSHEQVVLLLLAHPDIDVNQRISFGQTPFLRACARGDARVAGLLLGDPRVLVNLGEASGITPLHSAASAGHLEVIRRWIASGRDLDLGAPGEEKTDAIGAARREGRGEVVELLERFRGDPEGVRAEIRREMGR